MENSNQTHQETVEKRTSIAHGPIGNKFDILTEGQEFIEVDHIVAESFISNSQKGMLQMMREKSLNFNANGIYEIKYPLLENLFKKMLQIDAKYLKFSLVEINRKNHNVYLQPNFEQDNLIYFAVSLEDETERTIDGHNYLILNTDDVLENLRISDETLTIYKAAYKNRYLNELNKYFPNNGKGNTVTISYHFRDLANMLSHVCDKYLIYLCEISDVMAVIKQNNLRLSMVVYSTYYEFREKQLTMVAYSGERYFDMGSLYP